MGLSAEQKQLTHGHDVAVLIFEAAPLLKRVILAEHSLLHGGKRRDELRVALRCGRRTIRRALAKRWRYQPKAQHHTRQP